MNKETGPVDWSFGTGPIDWSFGKTVAFTLMVLICQLAAFRASIIKFICHTKLSLSITQERNIVPNPIQWLLFPCLSGNLISKLFNLGDNSGLATVMIFMITPANHDSVSRKYSQPNLNFNLMQIYST
uniref:Uncharacterized protein n=1 Tax=Onchocerca volvulus TaxID=6282 RepID=A0A8R1XTV5_ONCVO